MAETNIAPNTPQQQPAAPVQPQPPQPQPAPSRQPTAPQPSEEVVSWTASEFVAHEKSPGWYGMLALAALGLAGTVYLLTRDIISTAVVLVAALALAIIASRKPRQLQYSLDASGVSIGQKHLDYRLFKSFSVVPEGAFSSVVFRPLKRFSPLTTIYYAPEDEDRILNLLSNRLPFEEHKPDVLENAMKRIRF